MNKDNSLVVYISGPMRGIMEDNYPAFNAAASEWRRLGYKVINPAENFDGAHDVSYEECLKLDINQLNNEANAIAMLPGWDKSEGAMVEYNLARGLKYKIFDAITFEHLKPGALPDEKAKSVCQIADSIVNLDRQQDYGTPKIDFTRTAGLANAAGFRFEECVTGEIRYLEAKDIGMFMLLIKFSREINKHKRDNLVDICGYAKTIDMIHEN